MKIFDTHSHYNDEKYDEDREKLIYDLYKKGVDKITLIGASLNDSMSEKNLYEKYKGIKDIPTFYYAVGVHPDEIIDAEPDSKDGILYLENLEKLCKDKDGNTKAIAIGEIGLDYYGETKTDSVKTNQKKWFISLLALAKKLSLPVVIHSREACKDTLDIMKEYGKDLRGVIHCFAYEKEIAYSYIDMGYYIGIGGTVTFKNNRKTKDVVSSIPIEKIVTETDCPYLAPTPYRGERNISSHIEYVINEIATLKNMDVNEVENIVYKNALDLYGING